MTLAVAEFETELRSPRRGLGRRCIACGGENDGAAYCGACAGEIERYEELERGSGMAGLMPDGISDAGLGLIKRSEGFRDWQYLDAAGFPTIGYGHRVKAGESFADGVTEAQAETLLASDVNQAEQTVRRLVRVALAQGQFDALVDFVFNLGEGRFSGSTLLDYLNEGLYTEAAGQLLLWDHAGKTVLPGLKARREAEFELFTGHAAPLAAS
jgi:lysozyme